MTNDVANSRKNNDEEETMIASRGPRKVSQAEMEDPHYVTRYLFYSLGLLSHIPGNFFLTANDYWMYKFRDPNMPFNTSDIGDGQSRTQLQKNFTSNFSIISNVTTVVCLIITILLHKRIALKTRIVGCLVVMLVLFAITILFVKVNTDPWQRGFFVITLITGALLNGSGSMYMVTLFQMVSKFPSAYLVAMMAGQSICGIVASLIQIFTLTIGAASDVNAFIYFTIGSLLVMAILVFFTYVSGRSVFFKYHFNKSTNPSQQKKMEFNDLRVVFGKIKFYIISMIVVLGTTIMVNPAVTSLVVSTGKGGGRKWNDVFFVPVVTFLFFHLFDFIGREVSFKIQKPFNGIAILFAGFVRIIFIPLLLYCNAQPRSHMPVVFGDAMYTIIIIVFAFSNGYLVNLCVINIPKVTTENEKNIASILIVLFMIISLGSLNFFSLLLIKLI